ncbi:hypothetical protein HA402_002390 [Bradysia odoriphaga]|nr:hypothetical protein HA402_002390 [Bradysia odoriphaga]
MAQNHTLTNIEELEIAANEPRLRLALTINANKLHDSNPSSSHHHQQSFFNEFRQRVNNLFRTEERNVNDVASAEDLRRNQARVDDIFDDLINDLRQQRNEVKREMKDLSAQQQEDVITFWSGVQGFFKDVMKWMKNLFATVLEKIRQGFRIVKKVVVEIFQTVGNWFKSVFG